MIMGLIPVGDSDFFFVPRSCHVDQFTFHNNLISSAEVRRMESQTIKVGVRVWYSK